MEISESQEDVQDSETGKVGGDFSLPYMNISFPISTRSDHMFYLH